MYMINKHSLNLIGEGNDYPYLSRKKDADNLKGFQRLFVNAFIVLYHWFLCRWLLLLLLSRFLFHVSLME